MQTAKQETCVDYMEWRKFYETGDIDVVGVENMHTRHPHPLLSTSANVEEFWKFLKKYGDIESFSKIRGRGIEPKMGCLNFLSEVD